MAIFDATVPANSEGVKLGAQRIRETRGVLNTLLGFLFSDAVGTWVANTIPGASIQNASVTATQLGAGAVTTAKLAAGAVDTNALADASVTNEKLDLTDDALPISAISATSLLHFQNPILNGSFEDSENGTSPDRWTVDLLTGGSSALDTGATNTSHGTKSLKFVQPNTAGNGGGSATSSYFFEVSDKKPFTLSWLHKCSNAAMHDTVAVLWYDGSQVALGTPSTTLYNSVNNPTAWTLQGGLVFPPVGARYAKVVITAGKTDVNVGATSTSWWDEVVASFALPTPHSVSYAWSVTPFSWTCPPNTSLVKVKLLAGGAGGGGSSGGGGGGSGQYIEKTVAVVPGSIYTVTIGAGGAGAVAGFGQTGTSGGSTTFKLSSTVLASAIGGSGGHSNTGAAVGTGGAGGTGGVGDLIYSGVAGQDASGTLANGGQGGDSPVGAWGGRPQGQTANNGTSAGGVGAGGSGAGSGSPSLASTGGPGGDGTAVVEYF